MLSTLKQPVTTPSTSTTMAARPSTNPKGQPSGKPSLQGSLRKSLASAAISKPGLPCTEVDKKLLAKLYAKLRNTMMQLWLPSLCQKCKSCYFKATGEGKPVEACLKEFCAECKGFLKSKVNAHRPHVTRFTQKKVEVSPGNDIKERVISEIKSLIKPVVVEATVQPKAIKCENERELTLQLPLSSETSIYVELSKNGADWCRYCGTTAGTSWRSGPWGPRSLCFRHGRDYAVHRRLDLSEFEGVKTDREYPVLQGYCKICWKNDGIVRRCHGCANGFHAPCYLKRTNKNASCLLSKPWYCNSTCPKHFETGTVRVSYTSKEKLPLMSRCLIESPVDEEDVEKHEILDVVSTEPVHRPSFIIRLKEPVRPPTPIPQDVSVGNQDAPKKRRQSCPEKSPKEESSTVVQPCKKRRSRASSQSLPDFLITVDHTIHVRREDSSSSKPVLVPFYKKIDRPTGTLRSSRTGESLTDKTFTSRHERYEEMEKHTRLLKPEILSTLFKRN